MEQRDFCVAHLGTCQNTWMGLVLVKFLSNQSFLIMREFYGINNSALCSCLLPESLQVPAVKQLPEYHVCSEDGLESLSITTAREPTESDEADHDKFLLSSPSSGGEVAFIKEVQR